MSGISVEIVEDDPCIGRALTPAEFRSSLDQPSMFDELWPLWVEMHRDTCAGVDRFPLVPGGDAEVLARIFNGSTVAAHGGAPLDHVPAIPLPGAGALLGTVLLAFLARSLTR